MTAMTWILSKLDPLNAKDDELISVVTVPSWLGHLGSLDTTSSLTLFALCSLLLSLLDLNVVEAAAVTALPRGSGGDVNQLMFQSVSVHLVAFQQRT